MSSVYEHIEGANEDQVNEMPDDNSANGSGAEEVNAEVSVPRHALSERDGAGNVPGIDQAGGGDGDGNNIVFLPQADGLTPNGLVLPLGSSLRATSSFSDTASDNLSTRATLGDTPTPSIASSMSAGIDEDNENEDGNSSPASVASVPESEADAMSRMRYTVSRLEHDLAELVRVRDETIQFIQGGTGQADSKETEAPLTEQNNQSEEKNNQAAKEGEGDHDHSSRENDQTRITEQLSLKARTPRPKKLTNFSISSSIGVDPNSVMMDGWSYTPTGNYEVAGPLEGEGSSVEILTRSEDKAMAAKQVLQTIVSAPADDEAACFMRRFWQETDVVEDDPDPEASPFSTEIAAISDRLASLEASIEETFQGLRETIQEMERQEKLDEEQVEEKEGESCLEKVNDEIPPKVYRPIPEPVPYYDDWDKETSTNDCDIWNEIQNHESSYPINASRINKAESRKNSIQHLRRSRRDSKTSSSVGVGTNPIEGAELDDDSSDDDLDFLQAQGTGIGEPSSREFLREMGISEESEKKLFDLFKISEDEVSVPTISHEPRNDTGENVDIELPKPLFSTEQCEGAELDDTQQDDDEEDAEIERTAPRVPVVDNTPSITICPNREDDCSLRVYIDENYLNFPLIKEETNHNEDGDDCDH